MVPNQIWGGYRSKSCSCHQWLNSRSGLVMGVILSPGDEVLMADPGYPCNRNIVRAMEGRAVSVPVGPDTSYQLTAELIKKNWTENTVAALVASPSNPTGTVVSDGELRLMHDVVQGFGGSLIV